MMDLPRNFTPTHMVTAYLYVIVMNGVYTREPSALLKKGNMLMVRQSTPTTHYIIFKQCGCKLKLLG